MSYAKLFLVNSPPMKTGAKSTTGAQVFLGVKVPVRLRMTALID